MKIKKVNRYYCDYCKKSGGSKYYLQKHEEHCTKNPNRKCRMCEIAGGMPTPMNELLAIMPDPEQFHSILYGQDVYSMPQETAKDILEKLRTATNNCPACIMAALRQKGIFLSLIPDFDYKAEVNLFWNEYNSSE